MIELAFVRLSGISGGISIPAYEALGLLALLCVCLLFRLSRTGLVLAALFTYRWGWVYFRCHHILREGWNPFAVGYIVFGIIMFVLALLSMATDWRARS